MDLQGQPCWKELRQMMNKHIKMSEGRTVETRPSAALEVARLKLSGCAKEALGVQVHDIPGSADKAGAPTVEARVDGAQLTQV
jgi:hypothetical protein